MTTLLICVALWAPQHAAPSREAHYLERAHG